jgi:hypothetical protein
VTGSLWFTTSLDHGHPLDLRIAELLAARGFAGTLACGGDSATHLDP